MKHRYLKPDAVLADAIYSVENGGINPVRDDRSKWDTAASMVRYNKLKNARNCYQGFWHLQANERPLRTMQH